MLCLTVDFNFDANVVKITRNLKKNFRKKGYGTSIVAYRQSREAI